MDKSTQTVTGEGNAPRADYTPYDQLRLANADACNLLAELNDVTAQRDELLALVKRAQARHASQGYMSMADQQLDDDLQAAIRNTDTTSLQSVTAQRDELLAALKEMTSRFRVVTGGDECAKSEAQAAIAKAEGSK